MNLVFWSILSARAWVCAIRIHIRRFQTISKQTHGGLSIFKVPQPFLGLRGSQCVLKNLLQCRILTGGFWFFAGSPDDLPLPAFGCLRAKHRQNNAKL
eukprot:6008766-Amphidinium_carterae.1